MWTGNKARTTFPTQMQLMHAAFLATEIQQLNFKRTPGIPEHVCVCVCVCVCVLGAVGGGGGGTAKKPRSRKCLTWNASENIVG